MPPSSERRSGAGAEGARAAAAAAAATELAPLRAVFDRAPMLVAVHEGPAHLGVYANPRHERFVGPRPLVGLPLREALPELDGQGVFERFDEVYRTGEAAELREVRVAFGGGDGAAAGGERFLNLTLQPWLGADGGVWGVVSLARDVTEQVRTRERLRESEARSRVLADTAPVMVWMAGPDKARTYVNRPWLEFTGRTMARELGFGWTEGVHPADRDRCLEIYTGAFDARRPFTMDYRLRRADGEDRWVVDNGVPRFTPEGAFLGYIGSAIDITERKRAERRLAAERAVAHALARATSLEKATPRVLAAFCATLGVAVCELWLPDEERPEAGEEGRRLICAAVHAADRGAAEPFVEAGRRATFAPGVGLPGRVWQTGRPAWVADIAWDPNFPRAAAAAAAGLRTAFALPILTGDGGCVGVMAFYSTEPLAPEGPLLDMMAAVGRDLGQFIQRTRAEAALRESGERLRVALANAPLIVYHCDRELRYTWIANPHPDWPPERIIGRRDDEFLPPERAGPLTALKRRVLESGVGAQEELSLETSLGRQTWDVVVEPLRDPVGRITGLTVAALDISGRKGAEEGLRARNRTLETLLRVNTAIAAELDLERLVQRVTDAATELTGARFGAFFYNVADERGEAYQLYTLSGVPREAFARFPMPRNTAVFGPTFRGEGVVRSDDITKDPRYGRNAPYRGLPPGHLPVRAYMAAPVVSRSGEVLGGLFFGHPEPGVFTELAERLAVGIAAQAAIAIDNARLYRAVQAELAERGRAEEALREAAGRLAAIVDTAVDGIITIDERGTIETINPAALRTFGYEPGEVIGRNVSVLMPEPYRGEHDAYIANYLRTGERRIIGIGREVRGRRKDGSVFPLELAVSETRLGDRRLFTGLVRDITERKRAEAALRESEERLRFTIEAAGVGTWDWDMTTGRVEWSDNLEAIHGLPPGAFGGDFGSVLADMHPDDREGVMAAVRRAAEGDGRYHVEYRLAGRERAGRWVEGKGRTIRDAAGRPVRMAGICTDVTERKRAEEQQRMLLAELSHRVKNTLAVVHAIAERTGRGAATVADFLDAFQGRLGALASAHSLLTAGSWRGADLAGIARATLDPHLAGDDRVHLEVDEDLPLKPAVALTFALVLHELATNAGKHGALSVPGGRVVLTARVERGGEDGDEELRMTWREEGGPPVRPPTATGFGMSLLAQAIEYQHEGRTELEWRKEGLVCRLRLPLGEALGGPPPPVSDGGG